MLGSLKYEELLERAKSIAISSNNIRTIVERYGESMEEVIKFCDCLDSYSKFIDSSVSLNKDADQALVFMIEKNKNIG